MASLHLGEFFGYAAGNYSYGFYNVYFCYDSVSHSGNTLTISNAYINMANPNSGYTTNTIWVDSVSVNGTSIGISGSANGGTSYHNWNTGKVSKDVTVDVSLSSCKVKFTGHRSGQSANAQSCEATLSFSKGTLWNDINAWKPGGAEQNGLKFNLTTSDGGSWTDLTNEPSSFTKVYGTTATISNIRSNVTGAHYTSNNVTNNGASSFTWTFNTIDWNCNLYSDWNTYTVKYNANGGTGTTSDSSHTYGTAKNLTANGFSRSGYSFAGWATTTGGAVAYTNQQSVSNLTTTNGGTVNLYAKWTLLAPSAASITLNYATRTKIKVTVSGTGAELSNYTVYYRANSTGSYSSLNLGTGTSGIITGLQPNTTYQLYVKVTNAAGNKDSGTQTIKTGAYPPSSLGVSVSNVLPFTADVAVRGTGDTNTSITNYTVYYRTKPTKPIYDMPLKTLSDGSTWARIFYHNNYDGTVYFTSKDEVLNTQQVNKYSRLYLLNDNTYKGSDNKFEFMLCYNEVSGYNRWKQTYAPQNEYVARASNGSKVTGYEAISISWSGNYWGGLERYNSDANTFDTTYIDGSVGHGNWFFAIGTAVEYDKGIPSVENGSVYGPVELWVRIDDAPVTTKNISTNTSTGIEGLAEETDYILWSSASSVGGTNYSAATEFTTLADQAKIRIYNKGASPVIGNSLAGVSVQFTPELLFDTTIFDNVPLEYPDEEEVPPYMQTTGGTTVGTGDLLTAENARVWMTYSTNGSGYKTITLYVTDSGTTHQIMSEQYNRSNQLSDPDNLSISIPSYTFSNNAGNILSIADETTFAQLVAGRWRKGKTYFKKDGRWVKAKKIYIKINGVWKIGTNYDN